MSPTLLAHGRPIDRGPVLNAREPWSTRARVYCHPFEEDPGTRRSSSWSISLPLLGAWRPSAALIGEGIEVLDDTEVERILAAPEELLGDAWRRLREGFDEEHVLHVALLNGAVATALDEPHSLDAVALELIENDPDLRGDPSEMLALVVDATDLWSVKEADQVEKELETISDALDDDEYEVAWLASIAAVAARCWTDQHARRLETLVKRVRSQLPLTDFPDASRGLASACERFASEPALAIRLRSGLLADTLGPLAYLGSELDFAA